MTLKLYNTRTRQKEEFHPLRSDDVRMYVCGPTVYDYAHIGNARPVIVFDVLYRLLRHLYEPDHVTYVRNITDVDDKINARAAEEGVPIRELTERTLKQFHTDVAALGCLPPDVEPRATEHIKEMKAMIEALVARGCAYAAEDHVLFSVSSMPDYGQLSRRSLDEMQAGARVEVAPYKRDPMDFVLWKPSKEGEPGWPSPCGIETEGRPGWHIECSAMSKAYLGETFDIHGGGIDLVFPHHENELAQSRCAHDAEIMANIWMHNGFLQVEGQKMSKSLGNFVTIRQSLDHWHGQKWHGETIRLAMLKTHYRSPLDFTLERLREARHTLDKWYEAVGDVANPGPNAVEPRFFDALENDLNTPEAIHWIINEAAHAKSADFQSTPVQHTKGSANLIGLLQKSASEWFDWHKQHYPAYRADIEELIAARLAARKAKNWAEADRIRDELAAQGIALKDAKDPETGEIVTTWEIAR